MKRYTISTVTTAAIDTLRKSLEAADGAVSPANRRAHSDAVRAYYWLRYDGAAMGVRCRAAERCVARLNAADSACV